MSNTNNIASARERFDETKQESTPLNKAAIFDALAAANIDQVVVLFDGEGDSGQNPFYAADSMRGFTTSPIIGT